MRSLPRASRGFQPVAAAAAQQRRHLNIHEYMAHELMQRYGVKTPKGGVATSKEQAEELATSFGGEAVVKAQVLAGGRGKGAFKNGFQGGVHLVGSSDEAGEIADKMLGEYLVTKQTGEEGRICEKVMVVEKMSLEKEFYFAILMDRATAGPVLVASSEGGMDIEGVAATNPDAIKRLTVDIMDGLQMDAVVDLAKSVGFEGETADEAAQQMKILYDIFMNQDATQIEINPLALDSDGNVVCMDAKFNFDENAKFRQKQIFDLRDTSQENALDVVAQEHDLNFIALDGEIGCLVNGAGLAMSTMDIIQLKGGRPANFLDVGGGATATQVEAAFKLITTDPKVNCILVNIFGGIMRCDVIAQGVIRACEKLKLDIPVVLRLQGTAVSEAKALIAQSSLDIISADELDDAARKAVEVSNIVKLAKEVGLSVKLKAVVDYPEIDDGHAFTAPL